MIVRATPQGLWHVNQADHARFAADLLRLFRLPELVAHPRRELLLAAVSEHDNGWWEADAAPMLDSGGTGALDFRSLAAPLRQELWQRGVERFAGERPYLAALVAAHALRLAERWRTDSAWTAFRSALTERRDELLASASSDPATLAGDDRWLALADALSLAVCTGEPELFDPPGWHLELRAAEGREVALAPFPFAGSTVFELSCRCLPLARYPSAAALGVALATSPWRRERVRFLPL